MAKRPTVTSKMIANQGLIQPDAHRHAAVGMADLPAENMRGRQCGGCVHYTPDKRCSQFSRMMRGQKGARLNPFQWACRYFLSKVRP